jgi:hypothetical protein
MAQPISAPGNPTVTSMSSAVDIANTNRDGLMSGKKPLALAPQTFPTPSRQRSLTLATRDPNGTLQFSRNHHVAPAFFAKRFRLQLARGTAITTEERGTPMIGAGGLVVSIMAFAVGAVLDWAVTQPYQHGFNLNKVGWILMIVGVIGAVFSVIVMVAANTRRRRTVLDDGHGNVVRRVESTY